MAGNSHVLELAMLAVRPGMVWRVAVSAGCAAADVLELIDCEHVVSSLV